MKFKDLLLEKRSPILKKWYHHILNTYPDDASNFLEKEKNRFDNPVAYNTRQGIEGLYDTLLHETDPEKVFSSLDRIVRIRAVQDFSPAGAVGFIFLLKKIVREHLEKDIRENQLSEELSLFESKIDELALLSFDIYMKCRETIYEIRVNEVKNRMCRLMQFLEKRGFIWTPDEESEQENANVHNLT